MSDPYGLGMDLYRLRLEFGLGLGQRTVRESDPALRPPTPVRVRGLRRAPRGLLRAARAQARHAARIVAYEHRRAAGRPRYHADPRQFAIVKGVTA